MPILVHFNSALFKLVGIGSKLQAELMGIGCQFWKLKSPDSKAQQVLSARIIQLLLQSLSRKRVCSCTANPVPRASSTARVKEGLDLLKHPRTLQKHRQPANSLCMLAALDTDRDGGAGDSGGSFRKTTPCTLLLALWVELDLLGRVLRQISKSHR